MSLVDALTVAASLVVIVGVPTAMVRRRGERQRGDREALRAAGDLLPLVEVVVSRPHGDAVAELRGAQATWRDLGRVRAGRRVSELARQASVALDRWEARDRSAMQGPERQPGAAAAAHDGAVSAADFLHQIKMTLDPDALHEAAENPGIERRAQIDTETVKGLLIMNGGGAVALLAFLETAISDLPRIAPWVVAGISLFLLGTLLAVVHNHLRRRCSRAHEQGRPIFRAFGQEWWEPGVCLWSWGTMIASMLVFIVGGGLVCAGAVLQLLQR